MVWEKIKIIANVGFGCWLKKKYQTNFVFSEQKSMYNKGSRCLTLTP